MRVNLFNVKDNHMFEMVFEHLKSDKGRSLIKSGFRAAGITKAVQDAREGIIHSPTGPLLVD